MEKFTYGNPYDYDPENIKLMEISRNIISGHHEKWDGSGYPAGLKGTAIPIEARIVGIADIYDALSSRRPHKKGYLDEKCFGIIKDLSGNALDPDVVDAFFSEIDSVLEVKNSLE